MPTTSSINNWENKKFSSVLNLVDAEEVSNECEGRIFSERDYAKDWDSVYVIQPMLELGTVTKEMRKVTEPVLVMQSHSSQMAFVMASEETPVYFPCSVMETGYTLLFRLAPQVLPDFMFYISKYDSWKKISDRLDRCVGGYGWNRIGYADNGDFVGGINSDSKHYFSAEEVFRSGCALADTMSDIPSVAEQEKLIFDAKQMEKFMLSEAEFVKGRIQAEFAKKAKNFQ